MALRWIEGFEVRFTDSRMLDTYSLEGSTNYTFNAGRYGGKSASLSGPQGFATPDLGENSSWVVGLAACLFAPENNSRVPWVSFRRGSVDQLSFCLQGGTGDNVNNYKIYVYRGDETGTLLAETPFFQGNPNLWYYWEFKVTISAVSGYWELRRNGTSVLSGEGNTTVLGTPTADRVYFGGNGGSPSFGFTCIEVDDIYILDGSGDESALKDFLGEHIVEPKFVEANGDTISFEAEVAGSPAPEENWFYLRDVTYEGNDGGYVKSDQGNEKDTYRTSILEKVKGGISGWQCQLRARLEAAGSVDVSIIQDTDVGAEVLLGQVSVDSTTWASYWSVFEKDPVSSLPFTNKALRRPLGFKRDSSSSALRVTYLAIEVLAVPGFSVTSEDIPEAQRFFLHNWAEQVDIETSYLTDIQSNPITNAEERWSLSLRPNRILTPSWSTDKDRGVRQVLFDLQNRSGERHYCPIYCDLTSLALDAVQGENVIYCDPLLRRFWPGAKAVLVKDPLGSVGGLFHFQVLSVFKVFEDRISFEEQLTFSSSKDSAWLFPMMLCEKELSSNTSLLTDGVASLSLSFKEAWGLSALPGLAEGIPEGFPVYRNRPVLNTKQNWVSRPSSGVSRKGNIYSLGKGRVVEARGQRAPWTQSYEALLETREAAWQLLLFLDSRLGRADPFWVIGHSSVFEPVSSTVDSLVVKDLGVYSDISLLTHVGVEMRDGTVSVQEISSSSDNGATWTLFFSEDLPAGYSTSDIEKVSWAALARLSSDSFSEKWYTLGTCEFRFSVEETQDEKEVADVDLFSPAAAPLSPKGSMLLLGLPPLITVT